MSLTIPPVDILDTVVPPTAEPASSGDTSRLDVETTLATAAGLALPHFGTWCMVNFVEADDAIRRVAVIHPDPAKQRLARSFYDAHPPGRDDPLGAPRMIRTGPAVTRQLAVLLGGGVSLESGPGGGSVFTITLPLLPPERQPGGPCADTPPGVESQPELRVKGRRKASRRGAKPVPPESL